MAACAFLRRENTCKKERTSVYSTTKSGIITKPSPIQQSLQVERLRTPFKI